MQVCLVLVLAEKSMRRNPRSGTRTMFRIERYHPNTMAISEVNLKLIRSLHQTYTVTQQL
jgi:hypothetical protein